MACLNKWLRHVKKYQKKHKVSWFNAMKGASSSYTKTKRKVVKRKATKTKRKATKTQLFNEMSRDTIVELLKLKGVKKANMKGLNGKTLLELLKLK